MMFLPLQWRKWCWENGEHQAAAEVPLGDESKLCRDASVGEDHQGGAGHRSEQVVF